MKLDNGNNISGIFKYDPGVTYTPGDIVVDEEVLYKCHVESLSVKPSEDKSGKFKVWISDNPDVITNLSEYLSKSGNAFITSKALKDIIHYHFEGITQIPNSLKNFSHTVDYIDRQGVYVFDSNTNVSEMPLLSYQSSNDKILKVTRSASSNHVVQEILSEDYICVRSGPYNDSYKQVMGWSNWIVLPQGDNSYSYINQSVNKCIESANNYYSLCKLFADNDHVNGKIKVPQTVPDWNSKTYPEGTVLLINLAYSGSIGEVQTTVTLTWYKGAKSDRFPDDLKVSTNGVLIVGPNLRINKIIVLDE